MDYVDNIDKQIAELTKQMKQEEDLRNDLNDISGHVGEALAKQKFGTPYQVDYDGRLMQFVFRIGTSGKRGRVETLFSANKLIIKPRKFKAHVEFNKDVSLAETIGEVVRGILYTYYDLIDDGDHVY